MHTGPTESFAIIHLSKIIQPTTFSDRYFFWSFPKSRLLVGWQEKMTGEQRKKSKFSISQVTGLSLVVLGKKRIYMQINIRKHLFPVYR